MPMEPNTLFQQCRAGSLVLGQLVNVVASEKKKWTFLGPQNPKTPYAGCELR